MRFADERARRTRWRCRGRRRWRCEEGGGWWVGKRGLSAREGVIGFHGIGVSGLLAASISQVIHSRSAVETYNTHMTCHPRATPDKHSLPHAARTQDPAVRSKSKVGKTNALPDAPSLASRSARVIVPQQPGPVDAGLLPRAVICARARR